MVSGVHGIDCKCFECEKIRALLRKAVKENRINLIGLEKDKKKVLEAKKK